MYGRDSVRAPLCATHHYKEERLSGRGAHGVEPVHSFLNARSTREANLVHHHSQPLRAVSAKLRASAVKDCSEFASISSKRPPRESQWVSHLAIITAMEASGFVAAGGLSSRMGRDKGLLELDGVTLVEHVIAALSKSVASVSILANSSEYLRFGLPVIADTHRDVGPLEAIRTALANTGAPRVILCACDTPFVTPMLFDFLLDRSEGFHAVVPLDKKGMLEPLCAVYSREALDPATGLILSGRRKVSELLDRVRTRTIEFGELRHLPGAENFFRNINTPEEYAQAVETRSRLREAREK